MAADLYYFGILTIGGHTENDELDPKVPNTLIKTMNNKILICQTDSIFLKRAAQCISRYRFVTGNFFANNGGDMSIKNSAKKLHFEKTVIFSDFHGDLDIMARSFADKGLMRYQEERDLDALIRAIKNRLKGNDLSELESFITEQKSPVRLYFLGDCLDRYHYGYHIITFLHEVCWEKFNIFPVFLMGNHDLLNVIFMSNPFRAYELNWGTGHDVSEIIEYIENMGVAESLKSFFDLHGDELFDLQLKFYREGSLEIPCGHYSVMLRYEQDYSFFNNLRTTEATDHPWAYENHLVDALGLPPENKVQRRDNDPRTSNRYASVLVRKYFRKQDEPNWWNIMPDKGELSDHKIYSNKLAQCNIHRRTRPDGKLETLPIDWRLISAVWRRHYKDYFAGLKYIFHENYHLYVHGGLSPMSMMDPMVLGVLYDHGNDTFRDHILERGKTDIDTLIDRSNRIMSHVLENAMNDYEFKNISGVEIIDQMGFWRGVSDGFPVFGGPVWCDFEYMTMCARENERFMNLYRQFCKTTGIKRIICGHTHFNSQKDKDVRYRFIERFSEISLEYICIDNSCSSAYRQEPVLNGIEIDQLGNIVDKGETKDY